MSGYMNALRVEYEQKKSLYESFCQEIKAQLIELLRQESISLAVPVESRVKSWASISDKCDRSGDIPEGLGEIGDIAGLRIVLLFRRDQERVCNVISDNFEVLEVEDTQNRLSDDQFGYGSVHFEARPKQEWFSLPTLRRLRGLQAEIQVRTASQHIWAAASHSLQYKRESHVPKPVRRAINRAAALLEMVDLEFERVLAARESYVAELDEVGGDEALNTDILQGILAEELPPENAGDTTEAIGELLDELAVFSILTARDLRELMTKHHNAILSAEETALEDLRQNKATSVRFSYDPEQFAKGVFYSHVGLARQALKVEFGQPYLDHLRSRISRP